jgi:hypothetical protein
MIVPHPIGFKQLWGEFSQIRIFSNIRSVIPNKAILKGRIKSQNGKYSCQTN